MSEKPVNKAVLVMVGVGVFAKEAAKQVIGEVKSGLDALAEVGKEHQPTIDALSAVVEEGKKKLRRDVAQHMEILFDKKPTTGQSDFMKQVNKLAKKVANATNPPEDTAKRD